MSLRSIFTSESAYPASNLRFAPSNPLRWFSSLQLVGQEGLEPPTTGLEIRCSIQLSYCPTGHALAQLVGTKYDAFRKLKIENKEILLM